MKEVQDTMKDLVDTKQKSSIEHQCSKGNFQTCFRSFKNEDEPWKGYLGIAVDRKTDTTVRAVQDACLWIEVNLIFNMHLQVLFFQLL